MGNLRNLITAAVLLLAVAGVVGAFFVGGDDTAPTMAAAIDDALPDDGVVVYYFHGYKRCATCNRMEALAAETLDAGFAEQQRRGDVVFRSVNIEEDATRHFVTDYDLATKVVVMSERRDGREVAWRRLDEVWDRVADADSYRGYVAENLEACLAHLARDGG